MNDLFGTKVSVGTFLGAIVAKFLISFIYTAGIIAAIKLLM